MERPLFFLRGQVYVQRTPTESSCQQHMLQLECHFFKHWARLLIVLERLLLPLRRYTPVRFPRGFKLTTEENWYSQLPWTWCMMLNNTRDWWRQSRQAFLWCPRDRYWMDPPDRAGVSRGYRGVKELGPWLRKGGPGSRKGTRHRTTICKFFLKKKKNLK